MAQTGARFETYVLAAMSEVGLTHKAELYRRSGMGSSTWAGWFTGQRQPRGNSLRLASAALNKTPDELRAVWEGDKPHKPRRATETPDPLLTALAGPDDDYRGVGGRDPVRAGRGSGRGDGVRPGGGPAPRSPAAWRYRSVRRAIRSSRDRRMTGRAGSLTSTPCALIRGVVGGCCNGVGPG